MRETTGLVTWDVHVETEIPNSDWISPHTRMRELGEFMHAGGVATDGALLALTNGRRFHLEGQEYLEGYIAARVIDSETGQEVTDIEATHTFGGMSGVCDCGKYGSEPLMGEPLDGRPLPLSNDRVITSVFNMKDGTHTVIAPSDVDEKDADYIQRFRTRSFINPTAREFSIGTEGYTNVVTSGYTGLRISEKNGRTEANMTLSTGGKYGANGAFSLDMDGQGQVTELMVHGTALIRELGLEPSADVPENRWSYADGKSRARLLDAMGEALGMDGWNGLDLRLTASGLYAAIGQRHFDPTTILVPRA